MSVTTRRIVVGILTAVAVAAVVMAGVFFRKAQADREILDARESARLAACDYAPVMANYDFNTLDAYFGRVLDGATGAWKDEFEGTSVELREVLASGQVVSTVNDVQCAIKSGDTDTAEAIVVIGQSITSLGTNGQPQPGQLSMVLTLENDNGHWLVNKVDAPLLAG